MRLFLSVDVDNSTKLKAQAHRDHQIPTWVASFRSFYQRYPEELARQCANESVAVPELWKSLGDELVFCLEIATAQEVVGLLKAFRAATLAYQKPGSIQLKNAAWLADFPVGNSEVKVSDGAGRRTRIDFLGPHMDLGFRLTHKASVRRFVISVEVAMLIHNSVNALSVYYEGEEVLKGVLMDMAYPILWLDMSDRANQTLQERLRGPAAQPNELKMYCDEFARNSKGQVCRPYLPKEPNFSAKPENWEVRYDNACRLDEVEDDVASPRTDEAGVRPKASEVEKIVSAAGEALDAR